MAMYTNFVVLVNLQTQIITVIVLKILSRSK